MLRRQFRSLQPRINWLNHQQQSTKTINVEVNYFRMLLGIRKWSTWCNKTIYKWISWSIHHNKPTSEWFLLNNIRMNSNIDLQKLIRFEHWIRMIFQNKYEINQVKYNWHFLNFTLWSWRAEGPTCNSHIFRVF